MQVWNRIQGANLNLTWWYPSWWWLTQHWFCVWVGRPPLPSIESCNLLSETFPPHISWHASCFSESVPSVSYSRFATKRGKSLYFGLLGWSRHSRNSPVHQSITQVCIQSAHSERKKRSSWILFLNKSVYQLIPIHSVKVSTAFSRPSTERGTMLKGQHSRQSSLVSPKGMV